VINIYFEWFPKSSQFVRQIYPMPNSIYKTPERLQITDTN
jgi:hypothetical protein